jgi:SAM-dependent methyltransferase
MHISPQPRRQTSGTYIVPGRFDEEELTRLPIQDRFITKAMGGVLPEQPASAVFERILDIGCGVGSWLIQTALMYPTSHLTGIDINPRTLAYAREQAVLQQVSDRVEFIIMDALRVLDFPNNSFNLVNMRMGTSFVRIWNWPQMLQDFQRVVRPGAVIRVTDSDLIGSSTSEAFNRLRGLLVQTFYQAGYLFAPEPNGLLNEIPRLMKQQGIRDIQTHIHTLTIHGGTPTGQAFAEDIMRALPALIPFLQKWLRLPDDFDRLARQAVSDTQQPEFLATWKLLTTWGIKA